MDTNTTEKTPEQTPAPDKGAEALAAAQRTAESVARLEGQLSILAAAATAPLPVEQKEEMPDVVTDPEKAVNYLFEKKAGPLLKQQAEVGARTQKELVALKRAEDWREFGSAVEQMVRDNRIPVETLSQPGAYEKMLDMVRADHLDDIIKKRTEAALAQRAEADRAAALASVSGQAAGAPGADAGKQKFSDRQLHILAKLKVAPEDALKGLEGTTDDGIWIRGTV